MFLKKFSLILATVFLLNIGSAYAALAPSEPQRFEEMRHVDTTVGQFDTETLKYEKDCYSDELLLDVWIKTIPETNSGEYSLNHYLFRLNERELMSLDQIQYNSSGEKTYKISNTYDAKLWTQIIPETIADKWYSSILKYAHDNDKKLKQQYKNRKKAYNEKNTDNGFLAYFSGITPMFCD